MITSQILYYLGKKMGELSPPLHVVAFIIIMSLD